MGQAKRRGPREKRVQAAQFRQEYPPNEFIIRDYIRRSRVKALNVEWVCWALALLQDANKEHKQFRKEFIASHPLSSKEPLMEAPSSDPDALTIAINHFKDAPNWLCDCGQRAQPADSDWRWNGAAWEHHHGGQGGHFAASRVPISQAQN